MEKKKKKSYIWHTMIGRVYNGTQKMVYIFSKKMVKIICIHHIEKDKILLFLKRWKSSINSKK